MASKEMTSLYRNETAQTSFNIKITRQYINISLFDTTKLTFVISNSLD